MAGLTSLETIAGTHDAQVQSPRSPRCDRRPRWSRAI